MSKKVKMEYFDEKYEIVLWAAETASHNGEKNLLSTINVQIHE